MPGAESYLRCRTGRGSGSRCCPTPDFAPFEDIRYVHVDVVEISSGQRRDLAREEILKLGRGGVVRRGRCAFERSPKTARWTDAKGFDGASVIDGYFRHGSRCHEAAEEITHGSIS